MSGRTARVSPAECDVESCKHDFQRLEDALTSFRAEMRADIKDMREELKEVRSDLKAPSARFDEKLDRRFDRMIALQFLTLLTIIGGLFGLLATRL